MNATTSRISRTALRLVVAGPIAASAIALGGFAEGAHAESPGFEPNPGLIIVQPEPTDPKPQGPGEIAIPKDEQDPKPQGPGEIAIPKDEQDPKPQGPGDITNPEGDDEPGPKGPDDKEGPNQGDGPQNPGDKDGPNQGDTPEDLPADVPADGPADAPVDVPAEPADGKDSNGDVDVAAQDVPVPNRIDAGAASDAAQDEQGMNLLWLLAGGGVLTAAGSVLARKRRGTVSR